MDEQPSQHTDNIKTQEIFKKIIISLNSLIHQMGLYPFKHPVVLKSTKDFYNLIQDFLSNNQKISIVAMEKKLLVNNIFLPDDFFGVDVLIASFSDLGIDSIVIEPGINIDEITFLAKFMSKKMNIPNSITEIKKMFSPTITPHIQVDQLQYTKTISSGVESEKPGSLFGLAAKRGLVEDYLTGKIMFLGDNVNSFAQEITYSPKKIAEFVSGEIKKKIAMAKIGDNISADNISKDFINKIGDVLVKGAVKAKFKDLNSRWDNALTLVKENIFKNLSKAGITVSKEHLDRLTTKITDNIKVHTIVSAYVVKGTNLKTMDRFLKKLLPTDILRKRLWDRIEQELANRKVPKGDIDTLMKHWKDLFHTGKDKSGRRGFKSKFEQKVEERALEMTRELVEKNKALVKEKETIESVIRSTADGVVVVDNSGKVLLMNPAAERLLGTPKEQTIGKDISKNIGEEHLIAITKSSEGKQDEETTEIKLSSASSDTEKILRASTAVIENENGKTVGTVSVLSDITKQKELDKLKSDFVAQVSHELKTPLISIKKNLSIVAEELTDKIPESHRKFFEATTRNVDRLTRLINDLLDMAKLESGRGVELKYGKTNLDALINDSVLGVGAWAESKDITFVKKVTSEIEDIEVDRDKIIQVITNLIGNSIKFSPEGGKITITAKKADIVQKGEDIPYIQIGVKDEGPGIPASSMEKIFDKFHQLRANLPGGVSGIGLGLAIAKNIVDLHQGRVWVESTEGEGSEFFFIVPICKPIEEKASLDKIEEAVSLNKIKPKKRMGELLIERGVINNEKLEEALSLQSIEGDFLGRILIRLGYVSEEDIASALISYTHIPYIALSKYTITPEVINLVPKDFASKYCFIPIDKLSNLLTIVMANPLDIKVHTLIKNCTGLEVKALLSTVSEIEEAIEKYYPENKETTGNDKI